MTELEAKSLKVGKFFSLYEFLQSDTAEKNGLMKAQLAIPDEFIENIKYLCAEIMERVRNQVGPVEINSGWSCAEVNKLIGRKETSQHATAEACDFTCKHLKLAYDYIKNHLWFDQCIMERKGSDDKGWIYWIHVSKKRKCHNRGQAFYMSNGKVTPKFEVK